MSYPTDPLIRSVVVFSRNYLPINRIDIRRAIILLLTEKAEPIEDFGTNYCEIRSASFILRVPDTIRLTVGSIERFWKTPPVNRREVLKRDKHQCQYCGSRENLTLDHVIPRSKGGQHRWDNLVIACQPCNGLKGDRTPHQAGMILKTHPKAPIHPTILFAEQFWQTRNK